MVPDTAARISGGFAERQRDLHWRASVEAAGGTHLALDRDGGVAPDRRDDRCRHDGGVANVCALLVLTADDCRRDRSHIWTVLALLSFHASRMAVGDWLASDCRSDRLWHCLLLYSDNRKHPDICGTKRQFNPAAMARILRWVRFLVAHARDARLHWPLRGIVRGGHGLFSGGLHPRSRHTPQPGACLRWVC